MLEAELNGISSGDLEVKNPEKYQLEKPNCEIWEKSKASIRNWAGDNLYNFG